MTRESSGQARVFIIEKSRQTGLSHAAAQLQLSRPTHPERYPYQQLWLEYMETYSKPYRLMQVQRCPGRRLAPAGPKAK